MKVSVWPNHLNPLLYFMSVFHNTYLKKIKAGFPQANDRNIHGNHKKEMLLINVKVHT